jgi:hypothetical protein
MSQNMLRHCTTDKLDYAQWYMIGLLFCFTENEDQNMETVVVTTCRCAINPITNPSPVYSHSIT